MASSSVMLSRMDEVMRRIVDKSAMIVSRARTLNDSSDVTASDVAILLELLSQSHKIIDSAAVHVGKYTWVGHALHCS